MPFALLFILITVAIDSIGIGLIFPVMPDLLTDVLGDDLASAAIWGGVLLAAFSTMQFLCGPIIGNLSDRYGRRPVMLVALAVMALDYVVMALAQNIWVLLAGRLVAGIAAATHATANAYVADISEAEVRAKNFGLIGAAFGIGFVLGPMIGGAASLIDHRAPFWIAGLVAAANLTLGWFVLPESLPAERRRPFSLARANPLASFRAISRIKGLLPYLVMMLLFAIAYASYPAVWSFYGKAQFGWDGWMIGLSLAFFGICGALIQALLIGPVIRRLGEERTAATGMSIDVGAFLFYGFVTSGFWALAVTPIVALGGIAGPAIIAMMSNATPEDQQGELQGVLSGIQAIGMAIAPVLLTEVFWLFTHEGAPIYLPGAPFVVAGVLMAACVAMILRVGAPGRDQQRGAKETV